VTIVVWDLMRAASSGSSARKGRGPCVVYRGFLAPAEVEALVASLERSPLQPYTSCDEDLVEGASVVEGRGNDDMRNDSDNNNNNAAAVHVTKYVNTQGIFARHHRRLRRRVMRLAAKCCQRLGWGDGAWFRGCGWQGSMMQPNLHHFLSSSTLSNIVVSCPV